MNNPDTIQIAVQPLTRAGFEPFGAVIGPEERDSPSLNRAPGNLGMLWVQRALEFPSQPYMGTLRYYNRGLRCEFLQRHPASTVTLIPLSGRPSVVAAARPGSDGQPDVESAVAFLLDGSEGVVFHPNTWLRYAYPIGRFVDFAYVTQRVNAATANTTDDTERYEIDKQLGSVFEFVFDTPSGPGYEYGPGGVVRSGPERTPPWT